MKVFIEAACVFLLLVLSIEESRAIPVWSRAEKVMQECYGGWDMKVTLDAGVKGKYSQIEYKGFDIDEKTGSLYSSYNNSSEAIGSEVDNQGVTNNVSSSEDSLGSGYDSFDSFGEISSFDGKDSYGGEVFVGIKMTVPLYDRSTRLSRKEKTNSQIGKLADLYAKYEGHKATNHALSMETQISRRVMMDGGQAAISSYFTLLAQKEKSKALAKSAERQIKVILKGCGYVE